MLYEILPSIEKTIRGNKKTGGKTCRRPSLTFGARLCEVNPRFINSNNFAFAYNRTIFHYEKKKQQL